MNDHLPGNSSLLSRLVQNPVRLRARSRVLALLLALVSGAAGSGLLGSGVLPSMMTAILWLMVPVAAAGIGIGDAFFLRHGVGHRRVAWTALLGFLVAMSSCVILAAISNSGEGFQLVPGALYFMLVLGMIGVLGSGIAIASGKAGGYLSRRIQDVDDSGW